MRRGYFFLLIAVLTAAAALLNAEEIRLDIDTAVDLALNNNLALKVSRIDLVTKKRANQHSWNVFLPSVSLGTGLTGSGGSRALSASSPWDLSASISASLPLSAAGIYSMQQTRAFYDAETINFSDARKELERYVKKGFYHLIILNEKKKLIEQNIETAQKRYDQARANYENGIVSELTMLSAQVTLENLKPDLEEAKVEYEIAAMGFKQMLGLDNNASLSFEGSIEPKMLVLETGELSKKHLEKRLDIQSALKEIEILQVERKLTGAEEYTPTLSLSYTFRAGVNDPFRADWGSPGSRYDSNTFGIALSFPIDGFLPGSSSDITMKTIDDEIEKARLDLAQKRQLAEVEIASIVLKLNKSSRTMKALEKNVLLAQKTYDLTEQQYNTGVAALLEVEDAYATLQEAKINILEERYNYLIGLFDLEYALNTSADQLTGLLQ
jgi:outer membrane protein TolC